MNCTINATSARGLRKTWRRQGKGEAKGTHENSEEAVEFYWLNKDKMDPEKTPGKERDGNKKGHHPDEVIQRKATDSKGIKEEGCKRKENSVLSMLYHTIYYVSVAKRSIMI